MLKLLREAVDELSNVLSQDDWDSLLIDNHPPRVERLWRPFREDYRLSLHKIYPCKENEALFHSHPWPSAMKLIFGRYEMGVGYGETRPSVMSKSIMKAGAEYEMTDPNSWHYVRPLGSYCLTVMLTGRPWRRSSTNKQLKPLDALNLTLLLREFRVMYKYFPERFR